ncbi:hypothetical protein ACWKTM_22050 [Bacillus toyonensis]
MQDRSHDGILKTGWHKEGNQWYLLGKDGAMKTGCNNKYE